MLISRIALTAGLMVLALPAMAQVSDDEIDCELPENAEREECLVLLPAGDVTNFAIIGTGVAGAALVGAALGVGSTSGTTGTTGTTN